jgi:hypothetical protein
MVCAGGVPLSTKLAQGHRVAEYAGAADAGFTIRVKFCVASSRTP